MIQARMQATGRVYEFGPFRLDVDERRLLRDGAPVPLRAKVFDTLVALVDRHGSLVTKDALMRAVWPDAVVEEGNLAHNLTVLRKALGDREAQQNIETVPGKGYRFIAHVQRVDAGLPPPVQVPQDAAAGTWAQRLDAVRAAFVRKRAVATGERIRLRHVVGREREREALLAALDRASSGQAQVLCVTGEPGIGKSTLVEQFLAERGDGTGACTSAVGHCSERLAENEAYLPILDALESLLAGSWGAECSELMQLVAPTWYVQVAPLWASTGPAFAGVLADAKAGSRERMKRELAAFFEELSRVVPVVVFVDDLHWADASTVEALAYLARRLATARLLVVVAYRSADLVLAGHPFIAIRQELQRQNLCHELPIALLSQRDIEEYVRLECPDRAAVEELAAFIHGRTEGNPLFMADLIRHLRERHTDDDPPGSLAQDLPESIRSTIERRVDRLERDELTVLEVAAVQGQEFDSRIVADVLDLDAPAVEERLQRLDRVHAFVRRLHERELPDRSLSVSYAFAHVLYQHAIEETLTPSRKAGLSRAVAEALLRRYATAAAPAISRIAMLFEAARDFQRASDCFIAAAAHAARLYANQEAVLLSQRAIANAEKLDAAACHARVAAAAAQLGQLQMVLSSFPDAAAAFERAEQAAEAAGDVDARVNAICAGALAQFYQRRMELTRDMASRALAVAHEAGSDAGIASAEAVLGLERLCFGSTDEARASFDRCMPILIGRTPPPHALEAVTFSGLLHAWQLDYASAHRTITWTMDRARERGSSYHIILNLFVRGMASFNHGRLADGLRDLEDGMRLAEKNGERFWLSRFPNTLGWVHRELEDVETALRFDSDGARTARENGYAKPEAYSHVNLAQDCMAVGDMAPVLDHLNRAMELFDADVWFRWRYLIPAKAELARYWLLRGDTNAARQYVHESIVVAKPRNARKHLAWAHKILGDIAMLEERPDDARTEYANALALLEGGCPLLEWRVWSAAAEAASVCRDADAAETSRRRCRQIVHDLAASLDREPLRHRFLGSEAVRKALA